MIHAYIWCKFVIPAGNFHLLELMALSSCQLPVAGQMDVSCNPQGADVEYTVVFSWPKDSKHAVNVVFEYQGAEN